MINQIEKTYPAGVKKFGYASETCPVLTPKIGSALATILTMITEMTVMMLRIWKITGFIFVDMGNNGIDVP